jgi:hypothetical protein
VSNYTARFASLASQIRAAPINQCTGIVVFPNRLIISEVTGSRDGPRPVSATPQLVNFRSLHVDENCRHRYLSNGI